MYQSAFAIGGFGVYRFGAVNGLAAVGLRGSDHFSIAGECIRVAMQLVVRADDIFKAPEMIAGAGRCVCYANGQGTGTVRMGTVAGEATEGHETRDNSVRQCR